MNNEKIIKILSDDFKKQIKGLSIMPTIEARSLLIIHLKRDQYIKFKKAAELIMERNSDIGSIYTEFEGKYHHVGGDISIKDNINGYDFLITPMSPIKDKGQVALYRKIRDLSPKGKTRNAIIIGTHNGLIPLHIAHLYNRLYCIDINKHSSVEARDNIRMNKINNCLAMDEGIEKWFKDFENYKYTPPGRKHKIGLLLADSSMLNLEDVKNIIKIDPETIILVSDKEISKKMESEFIEAGFEIKLETKINNFDIHKIKKVNPDETV
jgi:tRNA/tmRNA/rRNA uracil-C5-methylase (TrmA/RlmC/RlmD family)